MKKILLTGVAGFIGSNLLEHFLKQNNFVLGIDIDFVHSPRMKKYITPYKPFYPDDPTPISNQFSALWANVQNIAGYGMFTKEIDTVYHLAAASNIKESLANPTTDLENNVMATHALLELMRHQDIKNIIFTSTSVVHGAGGLKPVEEEEVDFHPISQYAASKIACEVFIHAYAHVYGIKGWIFRLGNVIGKNEHRGVVYDFIKKLNKNQKELEILGDGKQVKSYVHVSDVVNGITWIPQHDNNKSVKTYNLATYDQVTVDKLADIVCDELKVKPKYNYTGGDHGWVGDVPQIVMSINKALSTGWKPKYKCEQAIRKAVRELK